MRARTAILAPADRLVVGAARRLGPRLGDTVLRAADALAGRVGRRRGGPDGVPRFALAAARAAWDAGDLPLARARVDALHRAHPGNRWVVELRERVLAGQGDVAERLRMLHRLHLIQPGDARLAAERAVLGEIIVTTPGWVPRIPAPARPVAPAGDEVVLHLERDPEAKSPPGFVVRTADADARPLDLGPFYPGGRPLDERLADQAWLVAAVGRSLRPALIRVTADGLDLAILALGLALRAHLGRPLVVAIAGLDSGPRGGELAAARGDRRERIVAAVMEALRRADHVAVTAERVRTELVGHGVAAERVTVVDDADGSATGADPGRRLRDVEAEVAARWTAPDRGAA